MLFWALDNIVTATYAEHVRTHDDRLKDLFEKLDTNGEGTVTPAKLRQVLSTQSDLSVEEVQESVELFKEEADKDNDGAINVTIKIPFLIFLLSMMDFWLSCTPKGLELMKYSPQCILEKSATQMMKTERVM